MLKHKKYKILLVDDDKFLLDMYLLKFKEYGMDMEIAENGIDALKKLREKKDFDVVILDLVMPNIDGFEVLENMKKEKLVDKMVVIVFSNQNQPLDIERVNGLAVVDGYIIKANTIPSEMVEQVLGIVDLKLNKI